MQLSIITLSLTHMNKLPNQLFGRYRKNHNLKLKDVAFLLKMDEGNLSRFENGKYQNPKAYLGYHFLFNLSINSPIKDLFYDDNSELIHRCFQLIEILETKSNTNKNRLRLKGVNTIIKRLTEQQESYDENK